MDFKSQSFDECKFTLFDADLNISDKLFNLSDKTIAKDSEYMSILDEVKKICKYINELCNVENIYYLPHQIELLCAIFQKDTLTSIYCFDHFWISKNSFMYLIELFSSKDLPEKLKWTLIRFFIEASFHVPDFSICLCSHSSAFNTVLNTFADLPQSKKHFNDIFKLIFNLAFDGATFFPLTYISRITFNTFHKKTENINVKEKVSFFLMNLIRSLTAKNAIDIEHPETKKMILMLQKWFQVKSQIVIEHMFWAFYFWYRNTSSFAPAFYETFFFDVVMNQINFNFDDDNGIINIPNKTCATIAISLLSLSLSTDNNDYLFRIYNNLPIQNIISLIFNMNSDISEETKKNAIFLCSNYAARGDKFIQNLLNLEFHIQILNTFNNFSFPLKTEFGYCITHMIYCGNQQQVNCFNTPGFVYLMNEFFDMQNDELILRTLRSFCKLVELNSEVLNHIDQDYLEEIAKDSQLSDEAIFISQKFLSFFSNANNDL